MTPMTGASLMAEELTVHHISIQKMNGYNLVTVKDFWDIAAPERMRMVLEKKIQFLDEDGNKIPPLDAVRSLNKDRMMDLNSHHQ